VSPYKRKVGLLRNSSGRINSELGRCHGRHRILSEEKGRLVTQGKNRSFAYTLTFKPFYDLTYRLHLQGHSACHLLSGWFLARLIFRPWRWRRYVPPKRRLKLNGLHGVISQKMIVFKTTALKTSNPTSLGLFTNYGFSQWCEVLPNKIHFFQYHIL
jgi:hypothetical protein